MSFKIDVYHSETCGSYYELRENLERALAELKITADVSYQTIYYDDAVSRNIKGSPSIWINGKDAFESPHPPGIL
jgi:predicted thioredoxin/glutaredoxin